MRIVVIILLLSTHSFVQGFSQKITLLQDSVSIRIKPLHVNSIPIGKPSIFLKRNQVVSIPIQIENTSTQTQSVCNYRNNKLRATPINFKKSKGPYIGDIRFITQQNDSVLPISISRFKFRPTRRMSSFFDSRLFRYYKGCDSLKPNEVKQYMLRVQLVSFERSNQLSWFWSGVQLQEGEAEVYLFIDSEVKSTTNNPLKINVIYK